MQTKKQKQNARKKEKKKLAKRSFTDDVNSLLKKMGSVPDGAKVKEVFLWELVLNATLALFQVRMESLVEASRHGVEPKLFIHIVPDRSKGTLSIIDNGIGMTRDDFLCKFRTLIFPDDLRLKKYMATIDKYSKSPDADDVDLSCIYSSDSWFGLGFFSAYMVADKVVISTKQVGDKRYVWKFEADKDLDINGGSFTIDEDTSGDTHDRATEVTLYLKKGHDEYLDERKLQELVNKYPKQMCMYPISILDDEKKDPIEKQSVVDDKEKEPDLLEEERFERLRKLFVEHLGKRVRNVDISYRVPEMPSILSYDRKTLLINPRHRMMKEIMANVEVNPDSEEVKDEILARYDA